MRKILFFTCLLANLNTFAQNPGYLGKHIGIAYQNSFFIAPTFLSGADNSTGHPYPIVWPIMKHGLTIDASVSKKIAFEFGFSYFFVDAFFGESYIAQNGGTSVQASKKQQRIDAQFFEGAMKIYLGKFIAPIGSHLLFRIGGVNAKLSSGNMMQISYNSYPATIRDTVIGKDGYSGIRLGIGYGQQRMLGKMVFLKSSFMIHAFSGDPFAWESGGGSGYTRDYIGEWVGLNTRVLNRYEINVGLGILLF